MPNIFESAAMGELEDENRRLRARVDELTGERDALTAAIDRHVARNIWQVKRGDLDLWLTSATLADSYWPDRESAEAAYRVANGFDFPSARTEALADGPAERGKDTEPWRPR